MAPDVSSRAVVGFVILLMCAIAPLRDPRPTRTITEVVSVTYLPARNPVPTPSLQAAATPQAPAGVRERSAERSAPVQASLQPPAGGQALRPAFAPGAVAHAGDKAAHSPRRRGARARAQDTSKRRPGIVRVASHVPASCAAVARHSPAPPQMPAIFVPVRELGLLLESKLVGPQLPSACDEVSVCRHRVAALRHRHPASSHG